MQSNYVAEKALGYGQFTAGQVDAARSLNTININGTVGVPDGTAVLFIVAEAQAIRWRDDGVAPTATVGQPLAVGAVLQYTPRNAKSMQIIGQVAGAIVNVNFYGQAV